MESGGNADFDHEFDRGGEEMGGKRKRFDGDGE